MNMIEYPLPSEMLHDVAGALGEALRHALAAQPSVSFAVPGGTTPGPLFDVLSAIDLDWSRVHVLLTDERWVPESDPQSNAALIRERLITNKARHAAFTPYFAPDASITSAAASLSEQLSDLLPIDVLLLGMGADMHTASLFPNSVGLKEALAPDAPMFLLVTVAGQKVQRFTLTGPVLRAARSTHVLITGAGKRDALGVAQTLSEADAPIQTVLPNATIHWSA
jgi:6-phosphogluconolactonase